MSIDSFVADPAGYSKAHIVQFQHQAFPPVQAGMQVTTANNWGGNWTAEQYDMIPGQFTKFRFRESGLQYFKQGKAVTMPDRIGKGSTALHMVEVDHGGIDLGIRFLPWKANTVTYMTLDNAATTFFTGPINGCSIYLGGAGGTWWAFHANRNNIGAHNAGVKATMTDNVRALLPVAVPVTHSVVYQHDYNDLGFVCGKIKHGQWRFYVVDMHGTASANMRRRCGSSRSRRPTAAAVSEMSV